MTWLTMLEATTFDVGTVIMQMPFSPSYKAERTHDIFMYMTQENVIFVHQFERIANICSEKLSQMYPAFKSQGDFIKADSGFTDKQFTEYSLLMLNTYGDTLLVPELTVEEYTRIHPAAEIKMQNVDREVPNELIEFLEQISAIVDEQD